MKINFIKSILALALGLLMSYGLYSFSGGENKILLSAGSFIYFAITLITLFSISFEQPRTTTNIKVISIVFFMIGFLSNVIFTFINFAIPIYIVLNGILLLLFILTTYSIKSKNQ